MAVWQHTGSCKQQGFSMVEVLVSLLVLSIGLLGLAALQTQGLRFNQDGQMRSMASTQAQAIIDRMYANPAGVEAGSYDNITGAEADPNCSYCTSAQIAQRDAFEWNEGNARLLPAGAGVVERDGDLHAVTIRWDNLRTGATGLDCGDDPTVDMACFVITVRME